MYLFSLCRLLLPYFSFFFFFNDTATTEIYTLSLHDALPISYSPVAPGERFPQTLQVRHAERPIVQSVPRASRLAPDHARSEEHTSELQSPCNLVCRLLLEKKNKKNRKLQPHTFVITCLMHVY